MKPLADFARLAREEKTLFVRALALVLAARLALKWLPPRAAGRAFGIGRAVPRRDSYSKRQIAYLVSAAAARVGGKRRCLPESFAAARLLRLSGYPAEIRVGLASRGGKLDGHAWTVSAGDAVTGGDGSAYDGRPVPLFDR